MSSFARATRSSSNAAGVPPAATTPENAPAAVKKLGNEELWSFPIKSRAKVTIESPIATNTRPSSIDLEAAIQQKVSADEREKKDPEDSFRFLCETEGIKGMLNEVAVCRFCKKGRLDVSFKSFGLATIVETICTNCKTRSATEPQATDVPDHGQTSNADFAVNC